VEPNPEWLHRADSDLRECARIIYARRRFGDLPVLAMFLERAGCDNEDILAHCRYVHEHTLGCWVLDAVLGKLGAGWPRAA
jgi:hypothetical protein